MAKKIIKVWWKVEENGNITGRIEDFNDERDKIVFINNYEARKRSFFEEHLPEHGEIWECEEVRDTIHKDVYEAYENDAIYNSDNPRVRKYYEKYEKSRTLNPNYLGALIVRLLPEGNLTRREEEKKEEKLKRFGPMIDFLPILKVEHLENLEKACQKAAYHRLLPFILEGKNNGPKGFYDKCRAHQLEPDMLSVYDYPGNRLERSSTTILIGRTTYAVYHDGEINAWHLFHAMHAWMTRAENIGEFNWTGKKLLCKNCQACPTSDKATKDKIKSGQETKVNCEFCGKNGIVRSSEKALA